MNPSPPDDKTTRRDAPGTGAKSLVVPDHELSRRIGSGAYGEVWLARSVMGTYRAIKVIYRRSFENARPYEREFKGIQKFEPVSRSHEGMVDILHVGRPEGDECFYYVMELADDALGGPDLDPQTYTPRTLREEMKRRGARPAAESLDLAIGLSRALEHLHSQGLIHRDIKPANIVFIGGVPKLADIGLVTAIGEDQTIVGTDGYLSPEGPGSPPADLYSLGKVLYEICTGKDRREFPAGLDPRGSSAESAFHRVIMRACEEAPGRRYPTALEMTEALEECRPGQPAARRRSEARGRWWLGGVAAVAAALLVAGLVWNWLGRAAATAPEKSLAVLPLEPLGTSAENEALCDGITAELVNRLGRVAGMRVASRSAVAALRGRKLDMKQMGEQLHVRTLLEGTLLRSGNKLRVQVQLANVTDGYVFWSESYEQSGTDTLALQLEVVKKVEEALSQLHSSGDLWGGVHALGRAGEQR